MKTEIIKIKGDWEEVANDCRATVSKGEDLASTDIQRRYDAYNRIFYRERV